MGPFITADERLTFESRFAQIRNKHDYVSLQSDLVVIAQKHGVQTPAFDVY